MYPFDFILSLWHRRQRQLDLEILWPSLRAATPDLSLAREAFLLHVSQERAWNELAAEERETILKKELK